MRGGAAVSIHDDLPAGHSGIAIGAADLKAASRVDVIDGLVAEQPRGHHAGDHVLYVSVKLGLLLALVVARLVLGRDDDRGSLGRNAVLKTERDLTLGIRFEEGSCSSVAVLRHLGEDLVAVV